MNIKDVSRIALISMALFLLSVLPSRAAELVMMEQNGCHWCERWHKEIGDIYPKTDEGKRAPLRLVDIHDPIPDDLKNIRVDRFTPSFVLVENGEEIGRIRGYPGDELFWWLLSDLIKQLLQDNESSPTAAISET